MIDPAANTDHMRDLLEFFNAQPWTEQERAAACASLLAAFVLRHEGRGATMTWEMDLTVKGVRSKMRVVVCDPTLEHVANG